MGLLVQELLELVGRHRRKSPSTNGDSIDADLRERVESLARLIARGEPSDCNPALLQVLSDLAAGIIREEKQTRLDPEIVQWAQDNFDEETFLADMDEIRRTGGLTFQELMNRVDGDHDA